MSMLTETGPRSQGTARRLTTEVDVSSRPGRAHPTVALRSGLVAPRLLGTAPGLARVALVATTATLLGGDVVDLRIHVGDGTRLELQDVAATVAYDGKGRRASWDVRISVGRDAGLLWRGEPLVVADGADVARTLRVDVGRGGSLLMRDVVVLGRHGEQGGSLQCRTTVSHAGEPLLVEELDLRADGGLRECPGVIGTHRVAETVTCVADPVPAGVQEGADVVRMDLAGPGLVARHLGSAAHESPLGPTWRLLSRQLAW